MQNCTGLPEHIDRAIRDHQEWSRRLLRCAVLKSLPRDDIISPDAHLRCHLGKRLARDGSRFSSLDKPRFERILQVHAEMHEFASMMCRGIVLGRKGNPKYLRAFERLQRELVLLLGELKTKAVEAIGQIDDLTQLPLRHGLEDRIANLSSAAQKKAHCAYFAIVDLDHFKRINDTHGHLAGDEALRHIGRLLREAARSGDIVVRFGGEEFVIAFSAPDDHAAVRLVERLLERVRGRSLRLPDGHVLALRASAGVTRFRWPEKIAAIVERADQALYTAKEGGRDRLAFSDLIAACSAPEGCSPA